MDASYLATGTDVDLAVGCAGLVISVLAAVHIVALIQCAKATLRDGSTKVVWILMILFLPLLGSLLWFAMGKVQVVKEREGCL